MMQPLSDLPAYHLFGSAGTGEYLAVDRGDGTYAVEVHTFTVSAYYILEVRLSFESDLPSGYENVQIAGSPYRMLVGCAELDPTKTDAGGPGAVPHVTASCSEHGLSHHGMALITSDCGPRDQERPDRLERPGDLHHLPDRPVRERVRPDRRLPRERPRLRGAPPKR